MDYQKENLSNEEKFKRILEHLDPEKARLWHALDITKVNPRILVFVVRSLSNLSLANAGGSITLWVDERGIVTEVRTEERKKITAKNHEMNKMIDNR